MLNNTSLQLKALLRLTKDANLLFCFDLGVDLEAGLFPNLEFNPHSSVEGCLYLITPEELTKLDNYMGYPEVCHVCV